jgi:tocopherol cyclase
MFKYFRSILHPEGYHGQSQKPPFFEGWYYKLVDASEQHRLAVIPGISFHTDPKQNHAFIQILDGDSGHTAYHRFPQEQFSAEGLRLEQRLGSNRFSSHGLELDLDTQDWQINGNLSFGAFTPWPVTWRAPGIMGWYAWAPFMQCYHGVISLDHEIRGILNINGHAIDFSGGRGYAEKDWGRSFPLAYIWLQSNHFEAPGTSFMASVAIIPWLRGAFPGFIIGIYHQHHLYRFASYTGALIEKLEIGDQEIVLQIRDRSHRLFVQALRANGGLLRAPTSEGMTSRIAETLGGSVLVQLDSIAEKRTILKQSGRHAGIDAAGELDQLLQLYRQAFG